MDPQRWHRITELFEEALERDAEGRARVLAGAPADERAEVESLLAHAVDGTIGDVEEAVAALAREVVAGAEANAAAPPGARLGRYVILDRVGSGGMGVVYAAWDPELDRRVAIKLLHHPVGGVSPLIREARALARLAHPNVLAIHDVGTIDGQVFLATEFVEGVTLRAWMATPRPLRELLAVLIAAGQGLAAAHAAGLVHRDIKPENIMVSPDGRVRVMDFGLAHDDAAAVEASSGGPGAARTGRLGTPAYMAPEQWEGGPVDARTDVYAFCITAWECLAGGRPTPAVERATTSEVDPGAPAPAQRGRRRLPRRILRVLTRGLSRAPQARYSDMGALLVDLQRDPWSRLARVGRVSLTAAAIGVIGAAAWDLTRPGVVSLRITGADGPLRPTAVLVGAHALDVGDGVARGEVPAGTYRLRVEAPDHVPREEIVEVERGRESHLDLAIEHEEGRLDLTVEPAGAIIEVDGVDHGGRLRGLAVDTGVHHLRARFPGHYDGELRWRVAADETVAGHLTLARGLVWSWRDVGVHREGAALGDLDGDGRDELVIRGLSAPMVVDPWRDRILWQGPGDLQGSYEHWLGDLDGDAALDLVVLDLSDGGADALRVWSGAALAAGEAEPRWSRRDRNPARSWLNARNTLVVDVDGDGDDDLVTDVMSDGVAALDGASGALLWHAAVGRARALALTRGRGGQRLVVITGDGRHAIALADGRVRWSVPATTPSFVHVEALRRGDEGGDDLLLATHDHGAAVAAIERIDGESGARRWASSTAIPGESGTITLRVGGDPERPRVVVRGLTLDGLDGRDGALMWRLPASRVALVRGQTLLRGVERGFAVHRLDDGAHLRDLDVGSPPVIEPAAFDWDADGEDELAIAASDGSLVFFDRAGRREGALYLPDSSPSDVRSAGDLDRDGVDELVIEGADGTTLIRGLRELWSRPFRSPLRAAPAIGDVDGDGRLEIVVAGDFAGVHGFHAFDAATGALRWSSDTGNPDVLRAPILAPSRGGGLDLIAHGRGITRRIDGRTGAVLAARAAPLGYASPALARVAGEEVLLLVPWEAGQLLAVDPDTLAARWTIPLPAGSWHPPRVIREGDAELLVLHLLSGELQVIDAGARSPRWSRPAGHLPFAPPTIVDLDGDGSHEVLYSWVGAPGDLVCLRLADGAPVWRVPGLAGRSSAVTVVDDAAGPWLIHATNGAGVVALDGDGTVRWRYRPDGARAEQPFSDGGSLVVDLDGDGAREYVTALRDGAVHVLDAETGALRRRLDVGERIEAPPQAADVDHDGVAELIVAGHDRLLRVFRTPRRR